MRRVLEKKERSLGTKLFLKGDRCNSPKCVMIRRPSRPGVHGAKPRRNFSEFGRQMQEKQKIQIVYGLTNRQMQNLFRRKSKDEIMSTLETRLDKTVFDLGFGNSARVSRQLVSHGHILVNGRKVTIPSFHVRIGNIVSIRPESKKSKMFEGLGERLKPYNPPSWLKLDREGLKGERTAEPSFEERGFAFDTSLVGQYFSK